MTAPIRVSERLVVPGDELRWRFDTSGGPGGQHANKSSTRVELSWDLAHTTAVPDSLRRRLLAKLGTRAPAGVVTVIVGETRSQWRNRAMARRRLEELLREALRQDPVRIATRVAGGARRRRAESKRRRSVLKRLRRPPEEEE
ncbi:MAG TPA: aminoacyl-tRNA hydrolase [Actinobacteria bacterium]|nr:aminoacyl-tRNA hydrolase [Actinomycetota bacterium]